MDLLQGEVGSSGETGVTSAEVERVSDMTEEDNQERATIPVIKTEPEVSCVCSECMHISYRLYPELPAALSVCTCETKVASREWIFGQFLRKENFNFVAHSK
jgi:hypothetical protein